MSRESLLRVALLLVLLAGITTLVVRDVRGPGPGTTTAPGSGTPSDPTSAPALPTTEPTSTPPSTPGDRPEDEDEDAVPRPPEGLEVLVCRALSPGPASLRVATFNTHASMGPPGSLDTVVAELADLQADVLLLQEVDRHRGRSAGVDQAAHLRERLDMDGVFVPTVRRGREQYGTLVLSRHEILQRGHFPLPGRRGVEPRALQWLTLDVEGRPLRVYNTHLEPVRPRLRQRQAEHVAAILAQEELPTVLGGDLNAWPGTPPLQALTAEATGLRDSWVAGAGSPATSRGGRKIDYLLVGPGVRPRRSGVIGSAVSDHARLWADVTVRSPRRCRGGDGDQDG